MPKKEVSVGDLLNCVIVERSPNKQHKYNLNLNKNLWNEQIFSFHIDAMFLSKYHFIIIIIIIITITIYF